MSRLAQCLLVALAAPTTLVALGTVPAAARESAAPLAVSAMSFNIRYGTAEDGANHWNKRRGLVFEVLRGDDFDFVGLQEALPFQLAEIAEAVPELTIHSRTRDANPETGEACAILYRADRWLLDRRLRGSFWLSESPQVPGSRGWDAALPRIVTWGRFDHQESGARLFVFNTHLDHRGERARVESVELLRRKIVEIAGSLPVLVLGDWNAGEDSVAMQRLRGEPAGGSGLVLFDPFRSLHPSATDAGTFNAWGAVDGEPGRPKIDAVFLRAGTEVVAADILRPRTGGRAASDHDPVTATFLLAFDRIQIEVVDLGDCSGCAGSIVRSLLQLDGVLRVHTSEDRPVLELIVPAGVELADVVIVEAVRRVGYTAGSIVRSRRP